MKHSSKTAVLLAAVLAVPLSGTAFAGSASVDALPSDGKVIDVNAKYEGSTVEVPVYKVDLAWGGMEFTYHETGTNQWNPATHEYDFAASKTWSADGNTVTVTNHSNAAVTANLKFEALSEYALTGSFDRSVLDLPSAVNTAVEEAPSETASLLLSGELPAALNNFSKVGRITVTLE